MEQLNSTNKNREIAFTAFTFALFFFVLCYKLTNASLWYDETIEYWYSKIMFGVLPYHEAAGFTDWTNMYQRIVTTFQPPLYNFVMYFWLLLHDSEWWFRFSGVIFGLVGMAGLFKTVKLISKNTYIACLSVVFATFTWRLIYYYQECAEYTLLLSTLFWLLYFFVRLLDQTTVKNIIFFSIAAVLPVYSQYGAVFPITALLGTAFIFVLFKKQKKFTLAICISYFVAFVVFALPLFFLFVKPQLYHQHGGNSGFVKIALSKSLVPEFYRSILKVVQWNFFQNYAKSGVKGLLVLAFLLLCAAFVFCKNRIFKILFGANVATYALYFFAVKTCLYANVSYSQGFGNRYNLFFVPPWIILLFAMFSEIRSILCYFEGKSLLKFRIPKTVTTIFSALFICFVFSYSVANWQKEISANWGKQNARGAVNAWYQNKGYEIPTFVSGCGANAFCYYVRHHEKHFADAEKNVFYYSVRGDTDSSNANQFYDWFNSCVELPQTLFYFESHSDAVRNKYINWFQTRGYTYEKTFNSILLKFTYHPERDTFLEGN